jgi:hypothetical protein
MMSAPLFDALDEIGRKMRGNNDPFGGIQVICVGGKNF